MTKRIAFGLIGLMFSVSAAAAPASQVESLNKAIAFLLQPFQDAVTKATVKFDKIETNKERALAFKATAFYSKKGAKGELGLVVDEFSYDYDRLVNPAVVFKGAIKGDLRLIMDQKSINGLAMDLDHWITQSVQEATKEYGEGVEISTSLTNKVVDANGDFVSIEGKMNVSLDFDKMPNSVKIQDEFFRGVSLSFKLNVKEGIAVDARIVMNTKYRGFDRDKTGLKEYLEKMVAKDPDLLQQLSMFIGYVDNYAKDALK